MDSELNIVMDELSSVKLRWRKKSISLSLLVSILDGDGPDSRWLSANGKIMSILVLIRLFFHFVVFVLFDSVSPWLSATAQDLSLGGCLILERDMTKVQRAKDYNAQIRFWSQFNRGSLMCWLELEYGCVINRSDGYLELLSVMNVTPNFVELLNSQQDSVFRLVEESQGTEASSQFCSVEESQPTPAERRERRKWTPTADIVLISSWQNTNKDPVLQQEKKSSGQNENDILKLAHEIFYNNNKKKFNLEHSWKELKNDQKWCTTTIKTDGISKKRKCEDSTQSSSSHATGEADQGTIRPHGVKAAKGAGKKSTVEEKTLSEFQSMWSIKQHDLLAIKERLSKMSLLDSLLAKKEPLADYEEALNKKLINGLLSSYWTLLQLTESVFDSLAGSCHMSLYVYGTATDTVDEYLRLGETTTRLCVENFVEGIINLFGDEYLRGPAPADLQRLLDIGEQRGFPGIIGSIDCMHCEWKNCPTAWKGQYSPGSGTLNDINVLDRSPVFDDMINGQAPQVTYYVNGREYHLAYYLTGDVERAFGVLQARFAIVKNPALFCDKVKIGKIMRACIILHNMIVEDERDGYTQFNLSEFQQAEDNGSSHVDLILIQISLQISSILWVFELQFVIDKCINN
uniref:No apical meristem-associated C-terminal domain-containing protein n=1 Tax=Brassica oleracea var. oleracea TaxID=109376 RepID=A0A0D3AN90_BRAOL